MSNEISTSSPKVSLGKHKAIVAAIVSGVVAAGSVLLSALSDGAIDIGEVWAIVGAGLAGAGLAGPATYVQPTTVQVNGVRPE